MASKKYNIQELREKKENWKEPIYEALSEEQLEKYLLQKSAVDMYINGIDVLTIQQNTGICHTYCPKLVAKCLKRNEFDEELGYIGLLPQKTSKSNTSSKHQRDFEKLLAKYPSLVEFIKGNYYGNKKYTLEKNMNKTTLHEKFLRECMRLGIQQHEYPFNTANNAYVSLCTYIRNMEKESPSGAIKRENNDTKQKYLSTGIGTRYSANAQVPFSVVQIDGHIIDMQYSVDIPNDDGTSTKVVATRAWLIAVIDVATRCILGYSVSQEFNYNQYDVMEAIKDSIIPKVPMDFTIPGLSYPPNGGFYSTAFPELQNVLFDIIMLDNAKSHLAQNTMNKLIDQLKCTVNFGSVATPETRGIIERFFGSLETRGFHKSPATTGSNIMDKKRNNPEKAAVYYNISYDQICELIEALIAEYNNTPHSTLFNQSPLEAMHKKIYEAGQWPNCAAKEQLNIIEKLNYQTANRVVRGRRTNGRHPYVHFMGSEYRGRNLSLTEEYINKQIYIEYNPRDISSIDAYTMEGQFIGTLYAQGEYGVRSNSVKTRKAATKLARERKLDKNIFSKPLYEYENYLCNEGKTNRRKATKADILRREQNKETLLEAKSGSDNVKPIKDIANDNPQLNYSDIKELSPEELYEKMFGSRRA